MADTSPDKLKRLEDRPWWPDLVALKDVLSLRELATRFGAAPAAISNALRRNGLDRQAAPPGPRANRDPNVMRAATAALARVEVPEAKLAVVAAPAVVARAVIVPRATAPNEHPATTAAGVSRGYQARIDGQNYLIVAASITDAADIATRSGRGAVSALELLGAALGA